MTEASLIPFSPEPLALERGLWESGLQFVAGVDEVGRGALAGPVVAAAVLFPANSEALPGIKDSKQLSRARREALLPQIQECATAIGVGMVDAFEIDRINILQATCQAMKLAISKLDPLPELSLIDGNQKVPISTPQRLIIKGDQRVFSIAAASIVAKVTRDRLMEKESFNFPAYGFEKHKGYGTKEHRRALLDHGASSFHRQTFLKRILKEA